MFNYYYLIISAAAIADTFFQKAVSEESELECITVLKNMKDTCFLVKWLTKLWLTLG